MKNVRRVFALCLALCMVLSMAVFAEAGAPGTIKEITADGADYDDGDVKFALTYDDATENGMYLILVLSDGKVIGAGKHDQLLENCDEYRIIAQAQMGDEKEAV